MKILDVTEFYSERGGGVRSHLTLKSQVLCRLGHQHVVVAPGAQNSEEEVVADVGTVLARPPGRAKVIRVKGATSPYDPTYHLLTRFDKIAGIVERERPDILEVHSPYLAALGAMRVKREHYGARTFQWHSDFIDTYAGVLGAKVGSTRAVERIVAPLWGLVRAIAKRCEATLVAAEWQMEKLREHGVARVEKVPFGIERETFRPEARTPEGRRELLSLIPRQTDERTRVVVGVGRFAVEKRWDVVIDAFHALRERAPERDLALVLLGDGPERARMEARAGGSLDIVLPGFVNGRQALASRLAAADLLLHSCPFETFGLSIAEAMSCGLPTVVPDEGGAAEMYVPGAGERYAALDVIACADAAERLLDRLVIDEPAMRAAASEAAARLPNVQEQFEGQIRLYERLLSSPVC